MGKITFVRVVWPSGEVWEYLADSLARGRKDIEYHFQPRGMARGIVRKATPIEIKGYIQYHWLNPKVSGFKVMGVCPCCNKEVRLVSVPYGEKVFCSHKCLREYYKNI